MLFIIIIYTYIHIYIYPYDLRSSDDFILSIFIPQNRYDMCRRRKGGRCTKGTAGMVYYIAITLLLFFFFFFYILSFQLSCNTIFHHVASASLYIVLTVLLAVLIAMVRSLTGIVEGLLTGLERKIYFFYTRDSRGLASYVASFFFFFRLNYFSGREYLPRVTPRVTPCARARNERKITGGQHRI